MVAFHGENKPDSLKDLLGDVLCEMARALGPEYSEAFAPFEEHQMHATLIGMEVGAVGGQLYGHWLAKNRNGTTRVVDIERFVNLLKRLSGRDPIFTIRFAGFQKAYCTCVGKSAEGWICATSDAEFHSCDRSACEASFYAYAPGPAMLTGWPVRAPDRLTEFPRYLYDFRVAAEKAGFADKYHTDEAPHWMDDDCYIKLGSFKKPLERLDDLQQRIRDYLSDRDPVTVDITARDVSIILYSDPSLTEEAIIRRVALSEAIADAGKVPELYEELIHGSQC